MVHIPPVGSSHIGGLHDSNFSAAVQALTQAAQDLSTVFSPNTNGCPGGLLANLTMEIAENAGSASGMTSLFNKIYSAIGTVLSDLNNSALNNLYITESGFGGSIVTYINQNMGGSQSGNLYSSLQQLQQAIGSPISGSNGTPGGLFAELQADNFQPSDETLSFLTQLMLPFQGNSSENMPLDPSSYPSSWTTAESNLYTQLWGAAADMPAQYSQSGEQYSNLLNPLGAITYALWAVTQQNNGNPNACTGGAFPCSGYGQLPPPSSTTHSTKY